MADLVGLDGVHAIQGDCDLCGEVCDPTVQELNALSCTFANCDDMVYHQDCLEKYLKSVRLETNRKTGFKCPRGSGKNSKSEPCPGKIHKSHPIHIRNDNAKKRRKAKLPAGGLPLAPPFVPKAKKPLAEELGKAKEKKENKQEGEISKKAPAIKALNVGNVNVKIAAKAPLGKLPISKPKLVTDGKELTLEEYEAAQASPQRPARAPVAPKPPLVSAWAKRVVPQPQEQPLLSDPLAFPEPSAPSKAGKAPKPSDSEPHSLKGAWAHKDSLPLVRNPTPPELRAGPPPPPPSRAPAPPAPPREQPSGVAAVGHKPQQHAAAPPQQEGSAGPAPVGMLYVAEGERLTPAQRKNLKRAEKKVVSRLGKPPMAPGSVAATDDSDDTHMQLEVSESDYGETEPGLVFPGCHKALLLRKAQYHVAQLAYDVGFPEWQCIAAIQQHGSNLEAAAAWLLDGQAGDDETARMTALTASDLPLGIDISEELGELERHQGWLRCRAADIEAAVNAFSGDVPAAVSSLYENHDPIDESGQTSAAATPAGELSAADHCLQLFSQTSGDSSVSGGAALREALQHGNGAWSRHSSGDSSQAMGLPVPQQQQQQGGGSRQDGAAAVSEQQGMQTSLGFGPVLPPPPPPRAPGSMGLDTGGASLFSSAAFPIARAPEPAQAHRQATPQPSAPAPEQHFESYFSMGPVVNDVERYNQLIGKLLDEASPPLDFPPQQQRHHHQQAAQPLHLLAANPRLESHHATMQNGQAAGYLHHASGHLYWGGNQGFGQNGLLAGLSGLGQDEAVPEAALLAAAAVTSEPDHGHLQEHNGAFDDRELANLMAHLLAC